MGSRQPYLPVIEAISAERFCQRAGREQLMRVTLHRTEHGWECRSTGSQSSGVLTSMGKAHGFLLMSHETSEIPQGSVVHVQVTDATFMHGEVPGYQWT